MRKLMTLLAVLATAFAFSAPASAQFFGKKDFIYEKGGYAIEGHDTVAYFDLDATDLDENGLPNAEAVKGDPQFSAEYQGATWIFASQAKRCAVMTCAESRACLDQHAGFARRHLGERVRAGDNERASFNGR